MKKRKVYLYVDEFRLITKTVKYNLETLKRMMDQDPEVKKIIILIKEENNDLLSPTEREYLLKKITSEDPSFVIRSTDISKTFKIIKKIEGEEIEIKKMFVSREDRDYFENGLKGLQISVEALEDDIDEVTQIYNSIMNNDYSSYLEHSPDELYDEYEWHREKLRGMLENYFYPNKAMETLNKIFETTVKRSIQWK